MPCYQNRAQGANWTPDMIEDPIETIRKGKWWILQINFRFKVSYLWALLYTHSIQVQDGNVLRMIRISKFDKILKER